MTNITIPIQEKYLDVIDNEVKGGDFDNRSQYIRAAIKKMIEDKEIEEILGAKKEIERGESFKGDIDDLIGKYA